MRPRRLPPPDVLFFTAVMLMALVFGVVRTTAWGEHRLEQAHLRAAQPGGPAVDDPALARQFH